MIDNEAREALIAKIEATNRQFFPENFSDTRYIPNSQNHVAASVADEYANIIGISRGLSRDKQLDVRDRIAALDVYRAALRDFVELGIGEELNNG